MSNVAVRHTPANAKVLLRVAELDAELQLSRRRVPF